MVFALKFAKDLFRLYIVKARLVRTGGHVLQMFVFRMRKKNYSFFHDIYVSLIKVIKVRTNFSCCEKQFISGDLISRVQSQDLCVIYLSDKS